MTDLANAYREQIIAAAGVLRHIALSPRETEAVALIAGGRGQKQAAHEMGIKPRQVRHLLERAKKKAGARSCENLIAIWMAAQFQPRRAA